MLGRPTPFKWWRRKLPGARQRHNARHGPSVRFGPLRVALLEAHVGIFGTTVVLISQPAVSMEIWFVSRVTAPFWAKALPH